MPDVGIRRQLKRSDYEKEGYLAWNAFVNVLAMEDYEDLSPIQRIAHLAFWYDTEVQNGGHFQYFENRGEKLVPETLDSLAALGANRQRQVLEQAFERRTGKPRKKMRTVREFVKAQREGEYWDLDRAYYDIEPDIQKLLERWLERHFPEFVLVLDE